MLQCRAFSHDAAHKLAAVHRPTMLLPYNPIESPQNWEDEDIPALLKSIEEELRGRIQVCCCASCTGVG